jgi:uncharacterized DUF497 family protein
MPKFVWDRTKAARNLRKHDVSFGDACRVFDDPLALDGIDDREDYGEERSNIIGMAGDRLLLVTYTLRGGEVRIISARPAEPNERRRYNAENR